MPKANMYQALHTTVIGLEGKPLEIQIRTAEMHRLAEYGIAAHVSYKEGASGHDSSKEKMTWLRQLVESESEQDPTEFLAVAEGGPVRGRGLRLHAEGRGHEPLGRLDPGRLRLLDPHRRRSPLRRGEGERQDRAASLPAEVGRHRRGSDREQGPRPVPRLAQAGRDQPCPQQDPRLVPGGATRRCRARRSRGPGRGTPQARPAPAEVLRLADAGRRDAGDGLPQGRGVLHRPRSGKDFRQDDRQQADPAPARRARSSSRPRSRTSSPAHPRRSRAIREASEFGIKVEGVDNVALRLAKCCRPVPGDDIVGYVSLGRGITIHQVDCQNVSDLEKSPERMVEVAWEGENEATFRVEIQIDAYDRTRLLEDLSRTFSEIGVNIISAACTTNPPMVKNRFVIEVGDTGQLKQMHQPHAPRRKRLRRPPRKPDRLTRLPARRPDQDAHRPAHLIDLSANRHHLSGGNSTSVPS